MLFSSCELYDSSLLLNEEPLFNPIWLGFHRPLCLNCSLDKFFDEWFLIDGLKYCVSEWLRALQQKWLMVLRCYTSNKWVWPSSCLIIFLLAALSNRNQSSFDFLFWQAFSRTPQKPFRQVLLIISPSSLVCSLRFIKQKKCIHLWTPMFNLLDFPSLYL